MFTRQVPYFDLYNLAPELDPQAAILNARVPATTPGTPDTFTTYNLQRVTYQKLTDDQLTLIGAGLADQWRNWIIRQADLDAAIPVAAPAPQPKWTLTINGLIWVVESVLGVAMNTAYSCLCRLSQPA